MHPSKHVHRGYRRAAARIAVAAAGSALLCTAAAGSALAAAHHSQSHTHTTHTTHKSAHPSAQPSATGRWSDFYLVRTLKNSSQRIVYELAVKRQSNGDISLDVLQLGESSSPPQGGDVVKPGWILVLPANGSAPAGSSTSTSEPTAPSGSKGWAEHYTVLTHSSNNQVINELTVKKTGNGGLSLQVFQLGGNNLQSQGGDLLKPGWILVLPANGSTPAAPTGPLSGTPSQANGGPVASPGSSPASSAGNGPGAANATQHSGTVANTSKTAQFAGIGAVVLIALLLATGLLIRRRRKGDKPAAQPDRPGRPRPAKRPAKRPALRAGRRDRARGKSKSKAAAASSPPPVSDPAWGTGGTGPNPAFPMTVPAWAPSSDAAAPAAADAGVASGDGTGPQQLPVPESMAIGLDDTSWPDYLMPVQPGQAAAAGPAGPAGLAGLAGSPVTDPAPLEPLPAADGSGQVDPLDGNTGPEAAGPPDPSPSSTALRMLGAQRPDGTWDETPGPSAQRHRLVSGDDQIDVVLAQAPAAGSPYLVWAPLPYDVPEDGLAFACLGTGDEGCLFVDLAAAPGVISIGGDRAAAARLAESVAHQLSMAGDAGRRLAVTVVGDAVPAPLPAGVTEVATIADLGQAGPGDATTIVFCDVRSNEETFALARYTATAQHRIIPVVLADVPDAPWSFTAQPSLRPSQPLTR